MHSGMWLILLVGLAMIFGAGIWGMRHPKQKGEPIGRTRLIVICIAVPGAVLSVTNFVLSPTH